MRQRHLPAISVLVLAFCLTSSCAGPPVNTDDLCAVFRQRPKWYHHASAASEKWDIPVPVIMAIMQKESRFEANARPPRRKFLWIFPGRRISTAYGYAQALNETWKWYRQKSGNKRADRNDFDDAIDFVAWYCRQSVTMCNIAPHDAFHHYIAYHQGQSGFNRKAWRDKPWLQKIAEEVSTMSSAYERQLSRCKAEFTKKRRWFRPF